MEEEVDDCLKADKAIYIGFESASVVLQDSGSLNGLRSVSEVKTILENKVGIKQMKTRKNEVFMVSL